VPAEGRSIASVTVWIGSREAVPVRALPLLNPVQLFPERVAHDLRFPTVRPGLHAGLEGLTAYALDRKGVPVPLPPVQWDQPLTAILALSAELDARGLSRPKLGYDYPPRDAVYDREALLLLPAGVFVWRDELEGAYSLPHWSQDDDGSSELCFNPPMAPETAARVMIGFEREAASPKRESIALSDEAVRYWMSRARWGTREAGLLLQEFDPRHPVPHELLRAIAEKGDSILHRFSVRGRYPAEWPRTPTEWIEKAKEVGITIPKSLKQLPNWGNWMLLESAYPWQLASLSLNAEPSQIEQDGPRAFPDDETARRFEFVTEAIKQRFKVGSYEPVNIAEFVAWAASKNMDMPAALRAMESEHAAAHEKVALPLPVAHDPSDFTDEDRDTTAMQGDIADTCLERRTIRLKTWLESEGIPETRLWPFFRLAIGMIINALSWTEKISRESSPGFASVPLLPNPILIFRAFMFQSVSQDGC